jgi:dihydrofolate reductase
MITLIAAVAKNGVIGKANGLPWHLPEDLKHFKALTMGQVVVMGRKTWESLPERFRPLPGRRNIVVTRNAAYAAPGAEVAASLEDAVKKVGAGGTATDSLFVIGGAELYAHALPFAQRLELTEIDAEVDGDAFFPALDRTQWREVMRHSDSENSGFSYAFVSYERVLSARN